MLKNYFKIAWRNLKKNKVFSAINIFGLAIGFACCTLIFLFIQHEVSFDKFNVQAGNIYRVTAIGKGPVGNTTLAVSPSAWAPNMKKEFPEIKEYVRFLKSERTLVTTPAKEHYYEKDFLFADSTFFNVFSFVLAKGDANHSLERPNTIVLTKEAAQKYFGNVDPIGKTLEVTTQFAPAFNLEITGIINEVPANSHFHFNGLISLQTMGDISNLWSFHMFQTYFLLAKNDQTKVLENKFKGFVDKFITNNPNADGPYEIHLQPITDIHLRSQMVGELGTNGSITYVYLFAGIAILVLVIACFNFMNLSTVRSLKRAKETGLRKVVGAERSQLIKQFLGESVLFAFLSFILSIFISIAVLPLFNQVADRTLTFRFTDQFSVILMLLAIAIIVGLLAGLHPAYVLSSFKPVAVLKGQIIKDSRGNLFRKTLVTFQFVISIALIASTILVYKQLEFIRNKKLGFDKDKIFLVSVPSNSDGTKLETFKAALLQQKGIVAAAASSTVPNTQIPVNLIHKEGTDEKKQESMQMLFVDHDFVPTMQMQLIAGRNFTKSFSTDVTEGFILNREAVKQAGWKSPEAAIGKLFQWVMPDTVLKNGKVVGIVEDFNITPLKSPVQPLVMHILPRRLQHLYIRFKGVTATNAITAVEQQFKKFYIDQPYEYQFLDDTINAMYTTERRLGTIFGYFAALAILIASLGILGLSVYSIQQRTREIGIRKILGATIPNIVRELSKEFLKPVLLAAVIASPLAWWGMHQWLEDFAYRVNISWWVFVLAGLIAIVIALFTISFQAVKAAMQNPVKNLRTE
jgi:putative ABC transport system permease protein